MIPEDKKALEISQNKSKDSVKVDNISNILGE